MADIDAIVVGAGVIGLAIARELALAGRDVVVIESERTFGSVTSSRNSEVIHAGIYYPTDSLKAQLCVSGRQLLYRYCEERNVAFRRTGKLIVATSESQVGKLADLKRLAEANGVDDMEYWTQARVANAEPAVRCLEALFSPSTGIVDSHGLMLALIGDIEQAGGAIAYGSPFISAHRNRDGHHVVRTGGKEPSEVVTRELINAAGLAAQQVAGEIQDLPTKNVPPAFFARGCYFQLSSAVQPFRHLIYPMPEPGGLGVHATIDLAGQVRFGPDVEWIDQIDYKVDAARGDKFYAAVRDYWPDLPDDMLTPAYAGVRPKLGGPAATFADFVIQGPAETEVPGLACLFGIESPGLTASLAIAAYVRDLFDT